MKIKNINGLSVDALEKEVGKGGRFVYFPFTISLLVITFKRTSGVYLLRAGESAVTKGTPLPFYQYYSVGGASLMGPNIPSKVLLLTSVEEKM